MWKIVCSVLIVLLSLAIFLLRNNKKKILVTGKSSTGKTRLINEFLGRKFDTVPTFQDYTVSSDKFTFTESKNIENTQNYNLIIKMFTDKQDLIKTHNNEVFCTYSPYFDEIPKDIERNKVYFLKGDTNKSKQILKDFFK